MWAVFQNKKSPLGGQQSHVVAAAWGPFLLPGRPKIKKSPLGGQQSHVVAAAWGPFLLPGRPKIKKAPLGGSKAT
ncbi:hypothetical protein BOTU111922_20705 [Bordetella tumulicola]